MMSEHTDGPTAMIRPAEGVPGLYNVQVTTGEQFFDLTTNQVQYLAAKNGWTVVPVKDADES